MEIQNQVNQENQNDQNGQKENARIEGFSRIEVEEVFDDILNSFTVVIKNRNI